MAKTLGRYVMKQVRALVLTGFGLNCDMETARAFELSGASAQRVHINSLVAGKVGLEDFHILVFGGGFSWGDDHGAGVIQALKLKKHLGNEIVSFVERGRLVMGICNGFQTLVNLGLLPGLDNDYTRRSVALTFNDCGNFRNQWVNLRTNEASPCVFTRGMTTVELPVRHGEGKFVTDDGTLARLLDKNQVVLRYADVNDEPAKGHFPTNPNGSMDDIAGICDPTGRVFGLMPHPEAFNHPSNHPDWPRTKEMLKRSGKTPDKGVTPGIQIFKNGVDYIRSTL